MKSKLQAGLQCAFIFASFFVLVASFIAATDKLQDRTILCMEGLAFVCMLLCCYIIYVLAQVRAREGFAVVWDMASDLVRRDVESNQIPCMCQGTALDF